jgi:hypothetical protein
LLLSFGCLWLTVPRTTKEFIMKKATFNQVWDLLNKTENGCVCTSSKGSEYNLKAKQSKKDEAKYIVASRNRIVIYIHAEDWEKSQNKHGVRIGGIFNGNPSIFDWYDANAPKKSRKK